MRDAEKNPGSGGCPKVEISPAKTIGEIAPIIWDERRSTAEGEAHPACAWGCRCGHVKEPPGVNELQSNSGRITP